ncbi:MAG: hypothetical protein PHO36_15825 [Parabacteroides sp.]|nr:hypothetical protein [Parabacteroides sp.]
MNIKNKIILISSFILVFSLGVSLYVMAKEIQIEGRFLLDGSNLTIAPFNIPRYGTADPTTTVSGDVWYRSNNLFYNDQGTVRAVAHTSSWGLISEAAILAGTETTYRFISAARLKYAFNNVATPTSSAQAAPKSYVDTAISNASSKWTTSGTNTYLTSTTNNVGIGTTNPTSKLLVAGKTQITDGVVTADTQRYASFGVTREASSNSLAYIAMTKSGTTVRAMGIDGSNNWTFGVPTLDTQIISNPWLVISSSGNVGIGTTTPGYKLDIRGDVSINNNVTGTAMSTIFTAGNTGKSYLHFPAISGSNDPGFIVHETSALTADSNKGVIHISPTDDNDNVNDYVSIHGTNDPETIKLYTGGNIYTTGSLLVAGTGNSYLSGNVGIGTTSPAYKLDVSGTGRFTGAVVVATPTASNHATTKGYVDGLVTGASSKWTTSGTNTYLTTTTNNVGIGTTSPSEKFHVEGKISYKALKPIQYSTGSNIYFYKLGNLSGLGSRVFLEIVGQNTYGDPRSDVTYSAVSIGNADNEFAAWQYTIGDGGTGKPLVIFKDPGGTNNIDVYVKLGSFFAGSVNIIDAYGFTLNSASQTPVADPVGVTATDGYFINSNVGIGTITPGYKLDVSGTGRFTGALTGTSAAFSGTVSVATPTASNHATTKSYVDGKVPVVTLRDVASGTTGNAVCTANSSVCLDVVVAAAPYPSLSYSCLWTNTGSTLKARCLK